jgi:glycosyltransferase involved in cell wall biosynthesis
MKKILLFLFALLLHAGEPTVCLNMIVKNETRVIRRCLESAKPLIDYWVIVDTGSTDGTQGVIREFLKDIPGELHERPWVNFEHNRNEALELAKSKADYTLFIDADDLFAFEPGFKRQNLDKDAYSIRIKFNDLLYERTQLIKNCNEWKWAGVVHEVLVPSDPVTYGQLEGVTLQIIGGGDRSQNPQKYKNDAKLLEAELKKDPTQTRTAFYLAQSYRDAGMYEEAIKMYERRAAMGGWDQEVFWSYYQIGILQEELNYPEEAIAKSYLKAFNFRPTRAEPLYRLANYYRLKENYFMAYLFSHFGMRLQFPKDLLFVETWVYDYGIHLEYSIASYWINRYEESYVACQQLLAKKLPQNIRECVERNLQFASDKLKGKERKAYLIAESP